MKVLAVSGSLFSLIFTSSQPDSAMMPATAAVKNTINFFIVVNFVIYPFMLFYAANLQSDFERKLKFHGKKYIFMTGMRNP